MADWPLHTGGAGGDSLGALTASTRGATVTTAAGANAKGAWVELSSSTPRGYCALLLQCMANTATDDYQVDLGIGGAGSEQVLVPDVLALFRGNFGAISVPLPIEVPSGVRLAARAQSLNGGSSVLGVHVLGLPANPRQAVGWQRVTQYGAASSAGVAVNAGATINTKGAWSQITASTTNPIRQLVALLQATNGTVQRRFLVDIGIGGAGSEQVLLGDLPCGSTDFGLVGPPAHGPFPVDIPAGTRLAMRCQSSTADATARVLYGQILGID